MHQPNRIQPKSGIDLSDDNAWISVDASPGARGTRQSPAADRAAPDVGQADAAAADSGPAVESLADLARRTLHARKLRLAHFPATMFGEPAWDMLLALYQDQHQVRHHIKRLCSVAGAPATTALRWIDYLERAGLVRRRASPVDKRVVFIELSAAGQHAIEKYLVDLRESSVAPPEICQDHRLSPRPQSGKLAQ